MAGRLSTRKSFNLSKDFQRAIPSKMRRIAPTVTVIPMIGNPIPGTGSFGTGVGVGVPLFDTIAY
jgi:hypothetical protein